MSLEQSEAYEAKFEKLSGYLDGELTQQEAQKVDCKTGNFIFAR